MELLKHIMIQYLIFLSNCHTVFHKLVGKLDFVLDTCFRFGVVRRCHLDTCLDHKLQEDAIFGLVLCFEIPASGLEQREDVSWNVYLGTCVAFI